MLAIKNNLMAANAARHLGMSYSALSKSVERLSSGLRINSAKDDAAGLAVRELMRADVAVIKQGSRNAQDGISMLQTMEGALSTIDDILIRMQALAEQASTGSYSSAQRYIMHQEFDELRQEIDRIAQGLVSACCRRCGHGRDLAQPRSNQSLHVPYRWVYSWKWV